MPVKAHGLSPDSRVTGMKPVPAISKSINMYSLFFYPKIDPMGYISTSICMVSTFFSSRVWIKRAWLRILLVVSLTGKKTHPCPRSRLRIWSRETGSAVPSRVSQPAHSPHSGWIWCLLTGFLPISAALHIYYTVNRHRVSHAFIGHAMAYRWRSLPRVCRHKAGSS